MKPGKIKGHTDIFGAPEGWDEARHGPCDGLYVCVIGTGAARSCHSAWLPDAEDLARIVAGAPIILSFPGGQPPVRVAVGDPSDAEP